MIYSTPDPDPGRCENWRHKWGRAYRCLDYENVKHFCSFDMLARDPHIGATGQLISCEKADPKEWVKPSPLVVQNDDGESIGLVRQKILTVLAQHPGGRNKSQISILTGYSIKSSSFANGLSWLRTRRYMEGAKDNLRITDAGREALGEWEELPTGDYLLAYWQGKMSKVERTMLAVLSDAYPKSLSKAEISERTGYSLTSSSFANGLSKLRTLELVEGYDPIILSETLT